jgi:hypothetical protein
MIPELASMSLYGPPLEHTLDEAHRLADIIVKEQAPLRLLGGTAIYLHSPTAAVDPLRRSYYDLDLVGLSAQRAELERTLELAGYQEDREFNATWGHLRLLYHDVAHDRQVDVFVDKFVMCHTFDLRPRFALDTPTLPLADLLLTKLQVVEINQKDVLDILALLHDHPLGDGSPESIDIDYIAALAANDWGIWRTITGSLDTVLEFWHSIGSYGPYDIQSQIYLLQQALAAVPKSLAWKVRAQVGERVRWYELPEEVNLE